MSEKDHGTSYLHHQKAIRLCQDGVARVTNPHRLDVLFTRNTITQNQRDTGLRYYELYISANPSWVKAFDHTRERVDTVHSSGCNVDHISREDLLRSIIQFIHLQAVEDRKPYSEIIYAVCIGEEPLRQIAPKHGVGNRTMSQLVKKSLSTLGKAFDVYS